MLYKGLMALPVVDERSFASEILRSELPVLVDFYAEWCAPCKTIAPEVEALARELQGKAKVVKVDIDRSPRLAQELRIQAVPTFGVFVGGKLAQLKQGAMRKAQLRALIEPFMPRAEGAVSAVELAQLLKQRAVVPVDIREAPVFRRAHLPGAVSFPEEDVPTRLAELTMLPGPAVLYCRSGDRSKAVAEKLMDQGIEALFLEGGLLGWEAEGLPIERPD